MTSHARSTEIELKLAVPSPDPTQLARRLAKAPLLARRKRTVTRLYNVYFDTPDQQLNRARVALRLRRVGSAAHPQWLQTLKMGGSSDSALSQRGEWESTVPGGALDWQTLSTTPWTQLDPHGTLFPALAPCFVTDFERTRWEVRHTDGSAVEIALDIGQIIAGQHRSPLCELEFELLSGTPQALFEVAQQIARTVAVLPATLSKAQRGYALARHAIHAPVHARPPLLPGTVSVPDAAGYVLRESFSQFTANLNALHSSNDPEVVHQARIGWRRFKSALRIFKPVYASQALPPRTALRPLLDSLGAQRDLDVALHDTLPPLAPAYVQADPTKEALWHAMVQTLTQAAAHHHQALRALLQDPALGTSLLHITQWLETFPTQLPPAEASAWEHTPLPAWARRRIRGLRDQLKKATRHHTRTEEQHRIRIQAKRLRYGIEALQNVLPPKGARRWLQRATTLQTGLGATRDIDQASRLLNTLDVPPGLAEFLRGVAWGKAHCGACDAP